MDVDDSHPEGTPTRRANQDSSCQPRVNKAGPSRPLLQSINQLVADELFTILLYEKVSWIYVHT
jgi:hypothetical protein